MNKRLAMLEKLTSSAQADSFAFYCLALEYRKEGRVDDAVRAFETLRARDAGYLPMYLMAGQMLREAARTADASAWLKQGWRARILKSWVCSRQWAWRYRTTSIGKRSAPKKNGS